VQLADGATVSTLRSAIAEAFPEIAQLLPRVMIAVNREYARPEDPVPAGASVALIPPIAGGAGRLSERPLELSEVIALVQWPGAGGLVTFTGTVRNESRGRAVEVLEYEAYPEMAEEKLAAVEAEVMARWPEVRCAMRHRVGALRVGEPAVVIAVAAPHRREAFAACEHAIDRLKETVPLWKKETGPDGSAWVEECVPAPAARSPSEDGGRQLRDQTPRTRTEGK
jgi:molybdopterin synthase catalytic subunit/molybdopterin converting factor small subunit